MQPIHKSLVLLVALLALAAQAADPAKTLALVSPTVTQYSVLYLGDERLQGELKLTPEQVQKVTAMLRKATQEFLNGRSNAAQRDMASQEQDRELTAILTAEQRARLRQIILQHLARVPAGPEVIATDAELARSLSLTDEQTKQMQARKPLADVLTPEQQKTWAKLTGPAFPGWIVLRRHGLTYPSPPRELRAIRSDWTASQLKLTDEQQTKIEDLLWKWAALFPDLSHDFKLEAVSAEYQKSALALLTAGQQTRLQQLFLQTDVFRLGQRSVYEHPPIADGLNLTREQREKITLIRRDRRKAMFDRFLTGEAPDIVRAKLKEHEAETQKLFDGVVTEPQRARLKEMLGTPGPDKLIFRILGVYMPFDELPPPPRGFLATYALVWGGVPTVQESLKLEADQAKKLIALKEEFKITTLNAIQAGHPSDETQRRAQAAAIDKRLAELLTPAQVRSLKQLTLWNYPFRSLDIGLVGRELLALQEMSDALKLTPVQLRRLERGAYLEEVLDPAQRKAWDELAGPPPAPRAPMPEQLLAAYPYESLLLTQVAILGDAYVQKELKLSDAQQKDVAAELKKMPGIRELPAMQVDTQGHKAWLAAVEKKGREVLDPITKILNETQRRRLQQLALQQIIRFPYPGALPMYEFPEVVAALKLTPEQLRKRDGLIRDYKQLAAMLRNLPGPEDPRRGDDRYEALPKLTMLYEKNLHELLTPEQQAVEKELVGEKYLGFIRISG